MEICHKKTVPQVPLYALLIDMLYMIVDDVNSLYSYVHSAYTLPLEHIPIGHLRTCILPITLPIYLPHPPDEAFGLHLTGTYYKAARWHTNVCG